MTTDSTTAKRRPQGLLVASIAFLVAAGATSAARADDIDAFTKHDWPVEVILRPLTLARGMLEISGDSLRISISKGSIANPIIVAPDFGFGLTRRLTVFIDHERSLCVAGTECEQVYDDIAMGAIYGVLAGESFQLAAHSGWSFQEFRPDVRAGLTFGLRMRARLYDFAAIVSPSVYTSLVGRNELEGMGSNDEFRGRLELQYQIQQQMSAFVAATLIAPFNAFGTDYKVPLGIGGTFALNFRIDLGVELRFADLAGPTGSDQKPADVRDIIARLAVRL